MFWTTYIWGLAAILGLMTAAWVLSVWLKNASLADPVWPLNFIAAATVFYLFLGSPAGRPLIVLLLAAVWGLRLAAYLTWRAWGKAEDFRYQAFRRKFGPERYWWVSFFQVFLLQGVLAWLVSSALLGGMSSAAPLTIWDGLAVLIWLIGFLMEAIGDWQLIRFKQNPENQGKLLTAGLWRYTRHPNYFGDAAVWWGFGLLAVSAGRPLTAAGAVLMTWLLLRVSGVTLLEKSLVRHKPGYEAYRAKTSPFIPWFPKNK